MSRPRIIEQLRINARFLRSVNIERDFEDAHSLDGYIATAETRRHLQRIGKAMRPESGQRAWRITGDFGSGKSSFALVLANLLCRPGNELPSTIRGLGGALSIDRSGKKLLPILVTGSREPIAMAVLRALLAHLARFIDRRRKLDCRRSLATVLKAGMIDDRSAVSLIEAAAAELVEQGLYGGILLIVDELGKFLEYAALNPEKQDVYFLQLLAEASSRSKISPIYTVGLLHQGFAEYAQKLPTTAQLEWAKVSERFEEIPFAQPLSQVVTLLAAALCVNIDHGLIRGWKSEAKRDMSEAIELGMFGPNVPKTNLIQTAPELFPLHPTLVPVLARFFRRFGQNERSLFSFLLSSEPFGLQDFASRKQLDSSEVYRIADFYDFAALNFSQRLSSQSFRSHWNHIDAVIRSTENEDQKAREILKTIGILNVLETPELSPSEAVLSLALGDPDDLSSRLKSLCKRNLLFNRGRAGYALWPYTSINLEQRIMAANDALPHAPTIAEVVRARLDSRPIVARRHYIQTGNLRSFDVRFLTAADFSSGADNLHAAAPADGTVAVILCESMAKRRSAEKFAATLSQQDSLVVAVSPPLDSLSGAALELERWLWVERHTPELKDDRFAAEEVSRQISTSSQLLENRINSVLGFRGATASEIGDGIAWYHLGQRCSELSSGASIQTFLSDLCDQLFSSAPRVQNELVNRHSISSAAASARQKLFKAMLQDASQPSLGLPEDKAPPEKSMYLSVLRAGGLHRETDGKWKIDIPQAGEQSDPLNIRPSLIGILRMLEAQPDRRVPVNEIYRSLRSAPYGVRDGLIPILLLTVFIAHETEIAIYEDGRFSAEVEENLAMRLARRPETFEFQLCRINGVRRALVSEIAEVVNAESAESGKLLSIVRPLCLFVDGLPEYARKTDRLSAEALALRNAIENAKEPAHLVFTSIPEALRISSKTAKEVEAKALASRLASALSELRRAYIELQNRMAQSVLNAFEADQDLSSWRTSISEPAETALLGLTEPDLRAFCLKLIDDVTPDGEWLEALGSIVTRCPPSRWRDRDEEVFSKKIESLAAQFKRILATCFDKNGALPDTAVRIAITPRNGTEKDIVLSLNPKQAKEEAQLRESINELLPRDKKLTLAALSKLMWDIITEEK